MNKTTIVTLLLTSTLAFAQNKANTSYENGKPFSQLLSKIQDNSAAIADLQLITDEIKANVNAIRTELSDVSGKVNSNTTSVNQLLAKIENLDAQVLANRSELVAFKDQQTQAIAALQNQLGQIEADILVLRSELTGKIDALRAELNAIRADVDQNTGDINSLLVRVGGLILDVASLNLDLQSQQSEITTARQQITGLSTLVGKLETAILGLETRIEAIEGAIPPGPTFKFTNTSAEDLIGNTWLDSVVEAAGTKVTVALKNASGTVVYSATGTKVGTWTKNQITSTIDPSSQYHSANHQRIISLDNGDKLMITGQNASNAGCGGSFGNGYGIVIYPSAPNYYMNPKMVVMPYTQTIGYSGIRLFNGWTMAHEITFNGNSFNTCSGSLPAFLGTFELTISN